LRYRWRGACGKHCCNSPRCFSETPGGPTFLGPGGGFRWTLRGGRLHDEILPGHNAHHSHVAIDNRQVNDAFFVHELRGLASILVFVAEQQFAAHAGADALDQRIMTMARGAAVGVRLRDSSHQPPIFQDRKRVDLQSTHFVSGILDRFADIERPAFFGNNVSQLPGLASFL